MDALLIVAIVAGIVVLCALVGLGLYNGLVRARNMADESWSGVDVQLKRRRDLVPNLVETVQGYAAHERQTFESVTAARTVAAGAHTPGDAAPAEDVLTAALLGLFAVAENYPDLKASANFLDLQNQLTDVEDNIAAARTIYNGNARSYNDKIQSFPGMLIARPLSFGAREYFEASVQDQLVVPVSF